MPPENAQPETLKYILENSLHPELLDSHPWTKSLIVLETAADNPEIERKSPGQQLVITVTKFFTQTMPATPPRRGKRLDTNWGEFGILAAQYFAPLVFGMPAPVSLRDAWGRIDQSILLFVFGKTDESISQEKKDAYKLVGDELEVAANSTLSDWHRKGIQQLMETLVVRESFLSTSLKSPAVITGKPRTRSRARISKPLSAERPKRFSRQRSAFLIAVASILAALIILGGFKAIRIYNLARTVREDVTYTQNLFSQSDSRLGKFKSIGVAVSTLKKDFSTLKNETESFFWMGPLLKWVPARGGDLKHIEDLATLADSMLTAADVSYQTFAPLAEKGDLSAVNPTHLTKFLTDNQIQLSRAQQALKQAEAARVRLNTDDLSPEVRNLILNKVDPLMRLMQDGLTVAVELPRVMGATNEGPKTYLILVQNEDELRPTGGFITAASTVLMQDGNIGNLSFVNSGNLDNWYKIYPAAPWQLKQYMNSKVLIFRDANWYTNYPTATLYAEHLYSYTNDHSVDGVIAFDQHLLVEVLGITGPIVVEDSAAPVDSSNVIEYMREAKSQGPQDTNSSPAWDNKAFLNKITYALIKKMFSGDVQWEVVSTTLVRALNEHHILVQVDNPALADLLARYQWDGAIRPGTGDFLMAVDTNIGFNKTNAVVESALVYDVDLSDVSAPVGTLTVMHKNNAKQAMICKQWLKTRLKGEERYPITDCYWNYLRVYKPAGSALLSATPQIVPDIWLINKQENPGQVNILEEDIHGVQAFGTLQVVPVGEALSMSFQFAMPKNILKPDSNQLNYTLRVQKQPGTLAVPFTLRVHLANNAVIGATPRGALVQDNNIFLETDLRQDLELTFTFSMP